VFHSIVKLKMSNQTNRMSTNAGVPTRRTDGEGSLETPHARVTRRRPSARARANVRTGDTMSHALPGAPVFERVHVVRPASTPKSTGIGAVRFTSPTTDARESESESESESDDDVDVRLPSTSRPTNGRGVSGRKRGGERRAKPRSRSTRTGAVSARTRLAFSPERALGQKAKRKKAAVKAKAKAKAPVEVKLRKFDGRLPGTRPARSESFKYLNEKGELEDLEEGLSKRRLTMNDVEILRGSMKRKREETNRPDTDAKLSAKKTQQKSAQARAVLDPLKRSQNVPFEANTLYSPDNVVVSMPDTLDGPKAWYTNNQLIEVCAPGALLDISAQSLTEETKAEISSALRQEVSGVKVPTFLRVRVLLHHLDTSGWTLTTVQVKATSPKSSAHDVEIVFNLTEEAAYGCVRLYRHAGKNGRTSKQNKLPASSTDASGSYVPPSTPPRARTPSQSKRKTTEQDGSSERSAHQQEDELVDVKPVPTQQYLVRGLEQNVLNGTQREEQSRLPSLPSAPPPAQGQHWGQHQQYTPNVAIGEISGFLHTDVGGRSAPQASTDYFDDAKHKQLSDFYNRVHEMSNITTPRRLAVQSDQMYAPASFLPRSPTLTRASDIPPPGVSTRPMEQVVTPTVYYVPVSIPPQGVSGVSITETIVGSVRVRITQEPLDQLPRSDPVMRAPYQHVPQRAADMDASSDIHGRRFYQTQVLPRVMQTTSQEDDDQQLAANLLMLKTSVTGKKRRTKSAPKHRSAPINKRVK